MTDYNELEGLAKAATQDVWFDTLFLTQEGKREHTAEEAGESARLSFSKSKSPYLHGVTIAGDDAVIAYTGNGPTSDSNSAFIAAANPQKVQSLINDLRALTKRVKELEDALTPFADASALCGREGVTIRDVIGMRDLRRARLALSRTSTQGG